MMQRQPGQHGLHTLLDPWNQCVVIEQIKAAEQPDL
jgi:hypothetical protein